MKVSAEEVRRVAALANLELDGATVERLRGQLERILEYVEQLRELDTSAIEPAPGSPGEGAAEAPSLRDDLPGGSLSTEQALSNAPESGQGHFKVPRILPG